MSFENEILHRCFISWDGLPEIKLEPTIIDKIFETNSNFYVQRRTTGKVQFLFFKGFCYNQLHNILRLFDVLPNFPFTTSETMRDYY